MISTKELYIHLGLPKTGTTTLQNRFFQNHNEYLYLGKFNSGFTSDADVLNKWIHQINTNLVRKDLPFFESFLLEEVLENQFGENFKESGKIFLSEENILSRCITPAPYDGFIRVGSAYNILHKLKIIVDNTSFKKVKFILVLRKQDDLIESIFAEEFPNFKSFMGITSPGEYVDYLFGVGKFEEVDSLLRYHYLVQHLDTLFGEENVLVLPYERMKNDPEEFLSELSSFMEIKPWNNLHLIKEKRDNKRKSESLNGRIAKVYPLRIKLAQLKSKLIGDIPTGIGNWLKFIDKYQKGKVIRLDKVTKEKIMLHYKMGNKQLADRVNDISEFGYY